MKRIIKQAFVLIGRIAPILMSLGSAIALTLSGNPSYLVGIVFFGACAVVTNMKIAYIAEIDPDIKGVMPGTVHKDH